MDLLNRIKNIEREDYYSKANLHAHSNFSDGEEDFKNLIIQAQNLGLEHFSITDHNTIEGYLDGEYKNYDFLIPGIEFDCILNLVLLHIIGYGIDPKNPELRAICAKSKREKTGDITRLFCSRHPKKVINAIHAAGGIAVLAHPCCCWAFSLEGFIKKLQKMGLDGVEVYYPYDRFRGVVKFHSRKSALEITEKLGLLKTGGDDCHTNLGGRNG